MIITPVNPITELQRLKHQAQEDSILKNVNKNMIELLELSTQSERAARIKRREERRDP
jgi:hypothetical protein